MNTTCNEKELLSALADLSMDDEATESEGEK